MTVNLFIGTSGWNYADWKRRFYPDDLKSKEFLSFYAKQFRTTEVNSSFYHLPKTTTCQNWAAQVPNDFVFAVKASRFITHIRRLKEATDAWRAFLEHTSALGRKRGPILLQFPPSFRKDTELLAAFLQGGSQIESVDDIHLAFEFRRRRPPALGRRCESLDRLRQKCLCLFQQRLPRLRPGKRKKTHRHDLSGTRIYIPPRLWLPMSQVRNHPVFQRS
jgi:uncharacterized protein YecE (DUF72 family)